MVTLRLDQKRPKLKSRNFWYAMRASIRPAVSVNGTKTSNQSTASGCLKCICLPFRCHLSHVTVTDSAIIFCLFVRAVDIFLCIVTTLLLHLDISFFPQRLSVHVHAETTAKLYKLTYYYIYLFLCVQTVI